jgi:hypothetical protein
MRGWKKIPVTFFHPVTIDLEASLLRLFDGDDGLTTGSTSMKGNFTETVSIFIGEKGGGVKEELRT